MKFASFSIGFMLAFSLLGCQPEAPETSSQKSALWTIQPCLDGNYYNADHQLHTALLGPFAPDGIHNWYLIRLGTDEIGPAVGTYLMRVYMITQEFFYDSPAPFYTAAGSGTCNDITPDASDPAWSQFTVTPAWSPTYLGPVSYPWSGNWLNYNGWPAAYVDFSGGGWTSGPGWVRLKVHNLVGCPVNPQGCLGPEHSYLMNNGWSWTKEY